MKLVEYIKTIIPVTLEIEQEIINLAIRKTFPKNHQLILQGNVYRKLHFIEKGLVRVYYTTADDKDITYRFVEEDSFVATLDSYISGRPSMYSMHTLEETTLFTISFNEFEMLLSKYLVLEKVHSFILRNGIEEMSRRLMALQVQSAQERYSDLIKNQPSILLRSPLGYIASYLGISQETLSRIRRIEQ